MPNRVWLMDFSCEATPTNYFIRLSILTMSSMISYSSSEHHILFMLSFLMIICVVLNKMPEDFVRREKVGAREQQVKGSVIDMIPHLKKKIRNDWPASVEKANGSETIQSSNSDATWGDYRREVYSINYLFSVRPYVCPYLCMHVLSDMTVGSLSEYQSSDDLFLKGDAINLNPYYDTNNLSNSSLTPSRSH